MMARYRLLLPFLLMLFLVACQRQTLDDLTAKLEQPWSKEGTVHIQLGAADIKGGNLKGQNTGYMSEHELEIIRDMEKAGLVEILRDVDLRDGDFHGFDAAFASSQRGIVRQITTRLTPNGARRLKTALSADGTSLNLRLYDIKVSRIVEERDVASGPSEFKFVRAEAMSRPTEVGRLIGGKYATEDPLAIDALFKKRKITDTFEHESSALGSAEDNEATRLLREGTVRRFEAIIEGKPAQ